MLLKNKLTHFVFQRNELKNSKINYFYTILSNKFNFKINSVQKNMILDCLSKKTNNNQNITDIDTIISKFKNLTLDPPQKKALGLVIERMTNLISFIKNNDDKSLNISIERNNLKKLDKILKEEEEQEYSWYLKKIPKENNKLPIKRNIINAILFFYYSIYNSFMFLLSLVDLLRICGISIILDILISNIFELFGYNLRINGMKTNYFFSYYLGTIYRRFLEISIRINVSFEEKIFEYMKDKEKIEIVVEKIKINKLEEIDETLFSSLFIDNFYENENINSRFYNIDKLKKIKNNVVLRKIFLMKILLRIHNDNEIQDNIKEKVKIILNLYYKENIKDILVQTIEDDLVQSTKNDFENISIKKLAKEASEELGDKISADIVQYKKIKKNVLKNYIESLQNNKKEKYLQLLQNNKLEEELITINSSNENYEIKSKLKNISTNINGVKDKKNTLIKGFKNGFKKQSIKSKISSEIDKIIIENNQILGNNKDAKIKELKKSIFKKINDDKFNNYNQIIMKLKEIYIKINNNEKQNK
jgi:hypothetical protein